MSRQKPALASEPQSRNQSGGRPKRAGDPWWEGFRDRLRQVQDRCGAKSVLAFAHSLGLVREDGKADRKVTGWFGGEYVPSADNLRLLGEKTGASVDWLLGFGVPQDRAVREQAGELSRALARHVVCEYPRRSRHQEASEGLALVLGAHPPELTMLADLPEYEELATGGIRLVLRHGTWTPSLLVIDNPATILSHVTAQLIEQADRREDDLDNSERREVLHRATEALRILGDLSDNDLEVEELSRPVVTEALLAVINGPLTIESRTHFQHYAVRLHNIRRAHKEREAFQVLAERLSTQLTLQQQEEERHEARTDEATTTPLRPPKANRKRQR